MNPCPFSAMLRFETQTTVTVLKTTTASEQIFFVLQNRSPLLLHYESWYLEAYRDLRQGRTGKRDRIIPGFVTAFTGRRVRHYWETRHVSPGNDAGKVGQPLEITEEFTK